MWWLLPKLVVHSYFTIRVSNNQRHRIFRIMTIKYCNSTLKTIIYYVHICKCATRRRMQRQLSAVYKETYIIIIIVPLTDHEYIISIFNGILWLTMYFFSRFIVPILWLHNNLVIVYSGKPNLSKRESPISSHESGYSLQSLDWNSGVEWNDGIIINWKIQHNWGQHTALSLHILCITVYSVQYW